MAKITMADGSVLELTVNELVEMQAAQNESETKEDEGIKVGDYVEVIGKTEYDDFEIGTKAKVVRTDSDGEIKFELLDGSDFDIATSDSLKKITKEEAEEEAKESDNPFQEDDYVKVMGGTLFERIDVGTIVKVEIPNDGTGDFQVKLRKLDGGISDYVRPEVLEKVEPKDAFNEGDVVVITGNSNKSRNSVGDIGVVRGYALTEVIGVQVPGKVSGNGNLTKYDEMRHATESEKEAFESEIDEVVFEVGDIVYYGENIWLNNEGYGEVVFISQVSGKPKVRGIDSDGYKGDWYLEPSKFTLVCKAKNREDK